MPSINRIARLSVTLGGLLILLYYLSLSFPAAVPLWSPPPQIPTQRLGEKTKPEIFPPSPAQIKAEDKKPAPHLPKPTQIKEEKKKPEPWKDMTLGKITGSKQNPTDPSIHVGSLEEGELLMVTASAGTKKFLGIPNLKNMVYENRMTYANKWGYDFMWANISSYDFEGDRVYWNKILVLKDALVRYPKAKWIWWMDIDIIIMNMDLDMYTHLLSPKAMAEQLVYDKPISKPGGGPSGWVTPAKMDPKDVNFLIASGGWGMNVGNFLMRRSEWTDWTLDMWTDPHSIEKNWTFPENDGWTHMYRHHKIVRDHTGCTNQNALNAYPDYNVLGSHWKEGDLFVHFAGCGGNENCPARWDKYWKKKVPYEVPLWIKEQIENGTAHIEDTQRGEPSPISELDRHKAQFPEQKLKSMGNS